MEQHEQTLPATGEQELEAALHALAKALKAISFYPARHPQRAESIASAAKQLEPLLGDEGLVLLWNKDGCNSADNPSLASRSATAKMLAREMLKRKLKRLLILPQLSPGDLQSFLSLLATDETSIYAAGGIEAEMLRAGISTIGANEIDLTQLRGMQQDDGESDDAAATEELTASEPEEEEAAAEEVEEPLDLQYSLLGMDILLGMLQAESKDSHFLQLVRETIDSAEDLKKREAFATLLPVLEALLDIHDSEQRSTSQKEFIRYAMEQIASGTMTPYLLDRIEERSPENETLLDRLCTTTGKNFAYPLIQRLCVAESLHARKTIAIALTRIGETAVPALIPMLKDDRWYVVRNMVTILGEIGAIEAVSAMRETARHPEPKVRKETIKAFLKINSPEGEQILVSMIEDEDDDVVRQAMNALGLSRSRAAVRPLLHIVTQSDALLKELALKKQAVAALGRIGDRQATAPLLDIIGTRGWLAPGRWQELKVAAATALGQLGDEAAIPLLKKHAKRNTPLGIACSDAADNLERLVK